MRAILVVLIAVDAIALYRPAVALESGTTCDADGDALWEIIKKERGTPPLQTPAPPVG